MCRWAFAILGRMSDPGPEILNDASPPAPGGLAVIADFFANVVQLAVSLSLALTLAGILCFGLMTASQQFTRAARGSRRDVQTAPTPQAMSDQLKSIARDPETQSRREQFVRQIEDAKRKFEAAKPNVGGPLNPR